MSRLIAVLMLVAPSAQAFFPEESKLEIIKVGEARHRIAMAFKRAGEWVDVNATDANKEQIFQALRRHHDASFTCGIALGHLLNSPGISGYFPDRTTRISNAFASINNCRDRIAETSARWGELEVESAVVHLAQADLLLSTFDFTLDYTDWQPPDFPASIGPHDDWFTTHRFLHREHQYLIGHTFADFIGFYGMVDRVPATCNGAVRHTLKEFQELISSHTRAWLLVSGIPVEANWGGQWSNDVAAVDAMVEAGRNLRPREFFFFPLASEYLWSKDQLVTISGRRTKQGMNGDLFVIGASVMQLASCVSDDMAARVAAAGPDQLELALAAVEEYRSWLTTGTGRMVTDARDGRLREFVRDYGDGWNDHDGTASTFNNFFHTFEFGPPAGPPPQPPECPEFELVLELSSAKTGTATCREVQQ